jgi:hypothetical protein
MNDVTFSMRLVNRDAKLQLLNKQEAVAFDIVAPCGAE